jgi:hypothetical protein
MYLCRLLRPGLIPPSTSSLLLLPLPHLTKQKEFVKIYSEVFGPLSSDAYSRFSAGGEADYERSTLEINAATEYLIAIEKERRKRSRGRDRDIFFDAYLDTCYEDTCHFSWKGSSGTMP